MTLAGLEELLGVTIQHEQPELEAQKSTLLAAEDKLKIELEGMEQKLLELSASEGNLLENKKLIDSLNTLKGAALKIKEKLGESAMLQASLDEQRDVFRPIAQTGSKLFFTLLDLRRINPMYQYSLPMFLELFRKAALSARQLSNAGPQERTRMLSPLPAARLRFRPRACLPAIAPTYAMHLSTAPRATTSGSLSRRSAPGAGASLPRGRTPTAAPPCRARAGAPRSRASPSRPAGRAGRPPTA